MSLTQKLGKRGRFAKVSKDTVSYLTDDIFYGDRSTLITEIGTAFITSPCGIQGAVVCQDLKGDHFELVKYIYKKMEDFVIEFFA